MEGKLDKVTRRWWFFVGFIILQGLALVPFASRNFSRPKLDFPRGIILLLAFFAFWTPGDPATGMPDFNPVYIFTQDTGLAFCLMTPVYLAILILFYPGVNRVTLRITGLVGLMLGIYNVAFIFGMDIGTWYVGVLHFPLVINSGYALFLSLKRKSL